MLNLQLAFNLRFEDLYLNEKLPFLDKIFQDFLKEQGESDLFNQLLEARKTQNSPASESELILALAPFVEDFLAVLFNVVPEVLAVQAQHRALAPLYSFKRLFVQRRALKKYTFDSLESFEEDFQDIFKETNEILSAELLYAETVVAWMREEEKFQENLDKAARYAAWAVYSKEGKLKHKGGVLFHMPQKRDFNHLLTGSVSYNKEGKWISEAIHFREGFSCGPRAWRATGGSQSRRQR